MTEELKFRVAVKDGRLKAPKAYVRPMRDLISRMEGHAIQVTMREPTKKRSLNQNDYYWGVVIPAVVELFIEGGATVTGEQAHEYLKERVGGFVSYIIDPDENRHKVIGSTTKLTTKEMEDYLEKIRAWAAGYGKVIPFPNEGEIGEGQDRN